MWNKIESYIEQHRTELDQVEAPSSKVWEGISQELDAQSPTRNFWLRSLPYWKTAAVILLGIGLAFWWTQKSTHHVPPVDILEVQKLAMWPDEQSSYEANIQELLQEVRSYNPDQHIFMGPYMEDVARLDRALEELHDVVKQNSLNEHIVDELSLTYEKKIDLLEELLDELNESNL